MSPKTRSRYTAARSGPRVANTAPRADVLAAGVLPWRLKDGGLEVLLIHRPNYDDWSWPKGKLDEGETLPQCAIRETKEEIDLKVSLGIPLPSVHYTLGSGASKEVWYWAAEVTKQRAHADRKEVDRLEWVPPAVARARLTNAADAEPLDALVEAHQQQRLRTTPFVLLRHAKAKPRANWSKAESDRPLAATGQRQALAVKRLLKSWAPQKIVSSPWTRCMQTVAPYLKSVKKSAHLAPALTEKKAKSKPHKASKEVAAQLDRMRPTVLCTHRPVLPVALEQIRRWVFSGEREQILAAAPTEDPFLRPGAVIVVQQAAQLNGTVVSVEVYDSFDG